MTGSLRGGRHRTGAQAAGRGDRTPLCSNTSQRWPSVLVAPAPTAVDAGRHRAILARSSGDRGRGLRLGVAAGLTALLVPVAGLAVPLVMSDPALVAQASATPKPGSPGGNHSKPGDNKKKKKSDNKKSNNCSSHNGPSARGSSSDSDAHQRAGSSFTEQTNANNRWTADGANRSVNTRIASQAQPPQPVQAPTQVIDENPTQGAQSSTQPTTPPQDTAPSQTPASQQQMPPSTPPSLFGGQQSTATVTAAPPPTPNNPSNPLGPATALAIGAAAAAASRRRSSTSSSTTSTNPRDNWDHGPGLQGPGWDLKQSPQAPIPPEPHEVTPDTLAAAITSPGSVPGSHTSPTTLATLLGASNTSATSTQRTWELDPATAQEQPWQLTGEFGTTHTEFPGGGEKIGVDGRYGLHNRTPIPIVETNAGDYDVNSSIQQQAGGELSLSGIVDPQSNPATQSASVSAGAFAGYNLKNTTVISGPAADLTVDTALKLGISKGFGPDTGTPVGSDAIFNDLGSGRYYVNLPLSVSPLQYVELSGAIAGVVDVPRVLRDIESGLGLASEWVVGGIPSLLTGKG